VTAFNDPVLEESIQKNEAKLFGYAAGIYGHYITRELFNEQILIAQANGKLDDYNRGFDSGLSDRRAGRLSALDTIMGLKAYEDRWYSRDTSD
jgi:hypothetical protein